MLIESQQLQAVFEQVLRQTGEDVFLDGPKLAAVYADLAKEIVSLPEARQHSRLIHAVYAAAPDRMAALAAALMRKNDVAQEQEAARKALYGAFFSAEAADGILVAMAAVFGQTAAPAGMAVSPVIHPAALSDALEVLDRQFGNGVWNDGTVLAARLGDAAPSLKDEQRLVRRVYHAAGSQIQVLALQLANASAEIPVTISRIQQTLREQYVDDRYIDAFLDAMTAVFGAEYPALVKTASPTVLNPIVSGSTNPPVPTRNRKTQQAGSSAQSAAGKPRRKKLFGIWKLLLLLLALRLLIPAGAGIVFQLWKEKGETVPTVPMAESEEPTYPKAVYPPVLEGIGEIVIQDLEHSVYDEQLTDLSNYKRISADIMAGPHQEDYEDEFLFAFPTCLYTAMTKPPETDVITFYGDDGSLLHYTCNRSDYKFNFFINDYSPGDVRRMLQEEYAAQLKGCSVYYEVDWKDQDSTNSVVCLVGMDAESPELDAWVLISVRGPYYYIMVVKYPKATDSSDWLIKEYYCESLLLMFRDNGRQDKLITYEEFEDQWRETAERMFRETGDGN